jgi:hypothetical protein
MTQQRRPLTEADVPVTIPDDPATITIHELTTVTPVKGGDVDGGMIDEVTLFVENNHTVDQQVGVSIGSGAPILVTIPAQTIVKVLESSPFIEASGTIDLTNVTKASANSMRAWGYYFTQG